MHNMMIDNLRPRSREHSHEKQKNTTSGSGKLHVGNLPLAL